MPRMTANILRNALVRPATRPYPALARRPFALARGDLVQDTDECIFCSLCQKRCPSQCLAVDKKAGTWEWRPFECVYCGTCVEVCPTDCLSQKTTWRPVATTPEKITNRGTPPGKKKPKKTPTDRD